MEEASPPLRLRLSMLFLFITLLCVGFEDDSVDSSVSYDEVGSNEGGGYLQSLLLFVVDLSDRGVGFSVLGFRLKNLLIFFIFVLNFCLM